MHCFCSAAILYFWREADGPEADWMVELNGSLLPLEVKLATQPKTSDAKHLKTFLNEYKAASQALVVSRAEAPYSLEKNIKVINFKQLFDFLNRWKKTQRT